ncbi:hypothetical protein BDP27DRAFT_1401434 [Rhodocollybia butyracea]|uniref:Uncharacterized protein n=1 Tax=Rhodocollybia butyracea TaxID=206335 RepID=A0A9P5PZM9_9AGAR|nr:hypothetical protein BDP27DRAFT_1401434 [Rhodocollybia butyracea]
MSRSLSLQVVSGYDSLTRMMVEQAGSPVQGWFKLGLSFESKAACLLLLVAKKRRETVFAREEAALRITAVAANHVIIHYHPVKSLLHLVRGVIPGKIFPHLVMFKLAQGLLDQEYFTFLTEFEPMRKTIKLMYVVRGTASDVVKKAMDDLDWQDEQGGRCIG